MASYVTPENLDPDHFVLDGGSGTIKLNADAPPFTGVFWKLTAPVVGVADSVTVTEVTQTAGVLDFNWIQVPRVGDGRVIIDATAMLSAPYQPLLVSDKVDRDSRGTWSHGPSLHYDVDLPGFLSDMATAVAAVTQLDYSGGDSQTVTGEVDGTPTSHTLDQVYDDGQAVITALIAPFLSAGATVALTPIVLQAGGVLPLAAVKSPTVGDSSSVSFTSSGSGELATIIAGMVSTPGVTAFAAGPNFLTTGTGEQGEGGNTHLWTDDQDNQQHHECVVVSDGTDIYTMHRTIRPPEMPYTVDDPSNWPEVPTNVGQALALLADRLKAVEDSLP